MFPWLHPLDDIHQSPKKTTLYILGNEKAFQIWSNNQWLQSSVLGAFYCVDLSEF